MLSKEKYVRTGHETWGDVLGLESFKKVLEKDPDNVEMLLKIGMFLWEPFHDDIAALTYFEKAMELKPNDPDVLFMTGYFLYHGACQYKRAKELFECVLAIDHERAECHYMMANALWHMRNKEHLALPYALKAIELQPEWFFAREQYIFFLIYDKEFDRALIEIDKAYYVLDKYYKNKEIIGINIMEQYYIDHSNGKIYENFKRSLDTKKKKIEKKRGLY